MKSIDKANIVINYLRSIKAEAGTIAISVDVNHLHKSYKIIKDDPNATEDEFLQKLLQPNNGKIKFK